MMIWKNKAKILSMAFILLAIGFFGVFSLLQNSGAFSTQAEHVLAPPAFVRQSNLLVLMYHDVSQIPPVGPEQIAVVTTAEKLAADIDALLDLGYLPISLEDYHFGLTEPDKKYFAITFDDGYMGVYDNAYPVLLEKQIPAAVFFNTGMEHYQAFLHYQQLQELEQSGLFRIYTHLAYHKRATEIPIEEYERQLDASIQFLSDYVGEKPMFLAYPYGDYDRKIYLAAREHGIALQFAQKRRFKADDILIRVNVPYNADINKLVKKAPHH